ncbi:uncharacterized protein LOC115741051 [Rhodamnia argentea]|uniref:Uncharacterized protein LOC115741051 n=1 Tax=Rhodamnia argentea TaxID=178133 RepID=A0A8B8P7P0_9MYRT|nr:uncharacterized protein LOC115741051 [Rhodamnia argentea]
MLLSQPKATPSPSLPHDPRSPHGCPRHHRPPTAIGRPPVSPTARIMLAVATWLRARHRSRRCLLLVLCSPLLVPLLCAAFPLLCAAELFLRLCCRKRRSGDEGGGEEEEEEEAAARLRRCEEGRCGGGGESEVGVLLQRYLEDQLRLVGTVYECGDDGDGDGDDGDVGFLESCRSPLLA